jgi:hypothetical protein
MEPHCLLLALMATSGDLELEAVQLGATADPGPFRLCPGAALDGMPLHLMGRP